MSEHPEQSHQIPPEEEDEPAEVYSVSQDQNGSFHFSRRDFLLLGMAAGGALLVKGVCPRFGEGNASTKTQPVQAGMMPLPKVYLHTKPSIDSDILDSLQQNDLVRLIGDHPDLGWVEVATHSGKQGWLKRAFVDFSRAFRQASRDFGFSRQLESRAEAIQSGSTPTPTNTPPAARLLGTNLAYGKMATASSVEDDDRSTWGPQNAVDGNTATRWSSAYSDPQWLQVDLGMITSIDQVRLIWEVAYGRAYKIQVSINGSSWTDIYTITSGDGGTDDLLNLTGIGRYIRMYGTARGTVYGYSLYEFEVYGAPLLYVFLPVVVTDRAPSPTDTPTQTGTTTSTPTQTSTRTPCSCNADCPTNIPCPTYCAADIPCPTHCAVDIPCPTHCAVDIPCPTHCAADIPCFTYCPADIPCFTYCAGHIPCFTYCPADIPCFTYCAAHIPCPIT
jgi:hypothetical protein